MEKRMTSSLARRPRLKAPAVTMIALLWGVSVCLFAENPQDLFKAGNALYAAGKFGDAAQKYQTAADQGFKNWVLDYNLGNAYFRSGQNGKAILHYERAFHMNSGQKDVAYNLNLATTKAGEPEFPTSALLALAWQLFFSLSITMLTVLFSLFFLVTCLLAGLALAGRRLVGADAALGLGFLFIALSGWLGTRIYLLEKPQGVVVTPVADVRSGPNMTYPANFTVPEGHRVMLLEEQEPIQGWLEIGVPDQGLKGWAPDSSVEKI